jgi:16S rRNA (adenine1518-N6/adenine1519-N6)-dimethyltransferase
MSEPERQTATEIRRRLEAAGVKPRHDLGQNFLIDLNLLDVIVEAAELAPSDVVLEVGTGTGSLTARLAQWAGRVIAVEYDPIMARLTAAAVANGTNVTLLNCDVLRNKNRIAAEVVKAVEEALRSEGEAGLKVVANLPYHVATPVISNVVATDWPWSRMVVTIQWELAERMTAGPGTGDYSALSVWLQSQCRLEVLRRLPPTVFWPRPKVDSAILRIDRDAERQRRITDRGAFHDFLRDVFTQRRKHLLGVVARRYAMVDRTVLESIHRDLGVPLDIRAEGLTVDQLTSYHERLSEAARGVGTNNG